MSCYEREKDVEACATVLSETVRRKTGMELGCKAPETSVTAALFCLVMAVFRYAQAVDARLEEAERTLYGRDE